MRTGKPSPTQWLRAGAVGSEDLLLCCGCGGHCVTPSGARLRLSVAVAVRVKCCFGGAAQPAQKWQKASTVFVAEACQCSLHMVAMLGEGALDRSAALGREMDDASTTIFGIIVARDQSAGFEAIDRRRHRAAGEKHLLSKLLHRQRTLVKQSLEDSEVGGSHVEAGDAASGVCLDGTGGLPEKKPQVDATQIRFVFEAARHSLI